MDIYLFDQRKRLIKLLKEKDIIECEQVQVLNSTITVSITGAYDPSIEQAQYVGMRDPEDKNIYCRYKIVELQKSRKNFSLVGMYELFDDLLGRSIIKDNRPQNWNVIRALETLLANTEWQVGNVVTEKIGSTSWYYVTPLEAFYDFLEKWRVEFKPRMIFSKGVVVAKYIDIYDKLSDDYGKWYEYGDKLLHVVAEQTHETISTAFYGRGKGEETDTGGFGRKLTIADTVWSTESGSPLNKPLGQEYLEFPEATATYGYADGTPRFSIIDFPSIEDPYELLKATYEHGLEAIRPQIHFSAETNEDGLVELGETVTIIKNDIGIRYKTRIFKIKRNLLNPKLKVTEFGDQIVKTTASRINNIIKDIEKNEVQTIDWLDSLRDQAIDLVNNRDAFKYEL